MKTANSKIKKPQPRIEIHICETPEETFDLGEKLGEDLRGGEVILLAGGLGAGKRFLRKAFYTPLIMTPAK